MEIYYKKLSSLINVSDIGKKVRVYNGKKSVTIRLKETMINHYVGEFIQTKKQGGNIHKIKIKKKIKLKK